MFLVVGVFNGCSLLKVWVGNLDCDMPENEIIFEIHSIFNEEGFEVYYPTPEAKENNYFVAIAPLKTRKIFNDNTKFIEWHIAVRPNKIFATAQIINMADNKMGVSVNNVDVGDVVAVGNGLSFNTLNDKTDKKYTQYWSVRQKLENLCGNKMIIVNAMKNLGEYNAYFK